MNKHRLFLVWLLYATIVSFLFTVGFNLGYVQLTLISDITYICYVITALYFGTELYMLFRIIQLDLEIETVKVVRKQFDSGNGNIDDIPNGMLKLHVKNIINQMQNKKHDVNQRILLKALHDELDNRNYGNYCGEIAVRLGLIGTVVGLIIAFWPFIDMAFKGIQFEPSLIQSVITQLMIGVSAAFFTTAAGLALGTLLLISGKIYENGASMLQDQITVVTETLIIPKLEERYEV